MWSSSRVGKYWILSEVQSVTCYALRENNFCGIQTYVNTAYKYAALYLVFILEHFIYRLLLCPKNIERFVVQYFPCKILKNKLRYVRKRLNNKFKCKV